MRAKPVKAVSCVIVLVILFGSLALGDEELLLIPSPKDIKVSALRNAVPDKVCIVTAPKPGQVEAYALQEMERDLKKWFGIEAVKVAGAQAGPPEGATVLVFGRYDAAHVKQFLKRIGCDTKAGTLKAEGFQIFTRGAIGVVAGKDDSGVLYGSYILVQLLRKVDGLLHLPQVTITDYTEIALRMMPLTGYYGKGTGRCIQTHARLRYNVGFSSLSSSGEHFTPKVLVDAKRVEKTREMVEDCHKRGMKAGTNLYFLGLCRAMGDYHPCPDNPEHVKLVKSAVGKLCEAGLDAFLINFDDIRQFHVDAFKKCEACRKKGYGLGGSQVAWVRHIKEVTDSYGGKLLITCPYVYFGMGPQQWSKGYFSMYDGTKYLKEMLSELGKPACDGVGFFHVSAFQTSVYEELIRLGMRDYVWWNNGGRWYFNYNRRLYKPTFLGISRGRRFFAGFANPLLSWYANSVFNKDTMQWEVDSAALKEYSSLPARTRGIYLCSNHYQGPAAFGSCAWDPARFNWNDTERALAARVFGPGVLPVYGKWKKTVRKFARDYSLISPYLADYPQRREALIETYEELERLYAEFLKAHETFRKDPGFGLLDEGFTREMLIYMKRNRKTLSDALGGGRRVKARIFPQQKGHSYGMERVVKRALFLSSPFTTYNLQWKARIGTNGKVRSISVPSACIGIAGPSLLNWLASGFFDVKVNGVSIGNRVPEFKVVQLGENKDAIQARWSLDDVDVQITFSLLDDDGLLVDGTVSSKNKAGRELELSLFAIPSLGSSDVWKDDVDKWLVTAQREVPFGKSYMIQPEKEPWVLFYDRRNDYPKSVRRNGRTQSAEGPCGFVLAPESVDSVQFLTTVRFVRTRIRYKKGTERFRVAVYDMNKTKNADAIRYFKQNGKEVLKNILSETRTLKD